MVLEFKAQIEQRVGRNLLRYQMAEARVKAALPLREIRVSAEGLESLSRTIEERKHWTLGQLMEPYQKAFETCCPEARADFEEHLRLFVDARNRLVLTYYRNMRS